LLWIGPAVFLILAMAFIFLWYRRRTGLTARTAAPLSSEEQVRLKDLLDDGMDQR
jgi:cytochrome c-type biogenesis protein CcmH/NrfF